MRGVTYWRPKRHADLVEEVERVGNIMMQDATRFDINYVDLAGYGLEVLNLADLDPANRSNAVGAALPALGLLPDKVLATKDDDDARRRLELNRQQIATLSLPIDPADRIRQLPIEPLDSFEMISALMVVIADGSTDGMKIADRLSAHAKSVDLSQWEGVGQGILLPESFNVVKLIGEFEKDGGEYVVTKSASSVGVESELPSSSRKLPGRIAAPRGIGDRCWQSGWRRRGGIDHKEQGTSRKGEGHNQAKADLWRAGFGSSARVYRFQLSLVGLRRNTLASDISEHFRVGQIEGTAPIPFRSGACLKRRPEQSRLS